MYLFGKSNPEAPAEVRCKATKALREVGIPYRVVYSGTVTGIKRYTLHRVMTYCPVINRYPVIN